MEQYIIKNVEALWPKINTTYHFDSKAGRSVTCDATADGAEYSIQFRMDNATAKDLYFAMSEVYQANSCLLYTSDAADDTPCVVRAYVRQR